MNFGNYTCLTKKDVIKISSSPSLWSSYSGTVKLNIKNLNEISSRRGPRYFGPSKMSLFSLTFKTKSESSYTIEVTQDFKQWSEIGKVQGTGTSVKFTDLRDALFQKQYYRVKKDE